MPVSHLPRDQLPVINRNGQLTSGVPFSTASSYAPSQSASSSRCITTPGPVVYDISYLEFEHIIDHLDSSSLEDLPPEWLKPHLILCDSGASTSVAPPSFAPHIDMQPFQNDITLRTATSQPIHIIGYKDIHLISKGVEFDARFYITNVKRPLLGLADIINSDISLNISKDNSNIYHKGRTTELILENNKLLLNAILVPTDKYILPQWVTLIQHNILNTDLDQEDINIEARRPKSLRSPLQPTPSQIEEHNLTHQPFRSWCPICQQTRGRPSQHRRRGESQESTIMCDYTFVTNPHHPPQTPSSGNRYENHIRVLSLIESTTGMSHAIMTHRKGLTQHQLHQAKKWIITNGFGDSVIQCDAEGSLIQLTERIASELGLRHRVSPPYSHQSQGRVERFHRTLREQIRTIRYQWAAHLGIRASALPPASLPWIIQHAVFIANRYIIHNNGSTSYSNNYHREYDGVILHFGKNIWAEIKNIPTKKLDSRNEPQKLKGIWLGRDTSTNEHLVALPRDTHRDHPSVSTTIYRCRGVTRMPSEQRFDAGFTSNIDWPTMEVMDDIEKASMQTFIQLRDSGTSLRASKAPRVPEVQPSHSAYPSDYIPPTSKHPSPATSQPSTSSPPGLAVPFYPTSSTTGIQYKHPPAKAPPGLHPPPLTGPPPAVHPRPATSAQHQPAGKQYNRPRVHLLEAPPSEASSVGFANLVDKTIQTDILHLEENIDQHESKLIKDLIFDSISLQYYDDDISQYSEEAVKEAISSELASLVNKDLFDAVDSSTLLPEEIKKVIKTKWVINDRPSQLGPSLKARFVAKGFSQTINNPAVETFAATPSPTSLRTLLLKSILRQWDIISLDISAAFINAPIKETIYVQPPPELYHDQPHLLWRLKKALYGLRSSPKLWADHLHSILTSSDINLTQLKADRCVHIGDRVAILVYVDDILVIGEATSCQSLITKINNIFELKHVTKLGVHQDLKFLGHRLVKHHDGSISISLQQDYYLNMLKPFNLHHDNVRPVTTTCAEPPRILPQDHLSPEDHRQYRQSIGQLIWASLIRPDLQYPAKTLTRHLQAPSSFDLKNLKHTLRYIKGSQHLRLVLGKDLHRHAGQPLDQLHPLDIKCFTDSDWAGDQESRKSTSGFIISILNTPLAFSSKTQGSIAQSSAEAELYAMASGVAEAIFIKQLLSEVQEHIGIKTFDIPDHHPVTNKPVPAITVLTDSTSATSLVQKMGLNRRSKHIELKFLWLQDHHKNGVIKVKRVSSLENPADIFTKNVSASTLAKHLPACGLQELRVGEGDNNNHHIFHPLTDTKFRKGSHQAQAHARHPQQEAEEQETDNSSSTSSCTTSTTRSRRTRNRQHL